MIKKIFKPKIILLIAILCAVCTAVYIKCTGSLPFLSSDASTVFSTNKDKVVHEDLNGDGKKESITVKSSDSGLTACVTYKKDKSYTLEPNPDIGILGEHCSYWPTRVSAVDITRDNGKDIIIQSSFHNKAIQHVFLWNGEGYTAALASTDNLFGIMDSHNNKSPKIFSGNFNAGTLGFTSYICNKGILKQFDSNMAESIPGLDTTSNFICLIESFPNMYLSVPDYIYPQISGNDIETLFRLANSSCAYTFQDGYFTDTSWDKYGTATCENWILNFRSALTNDSNKISNITIDITINKYEDTNFPYKITSINVY